MVDYFQDLVLTRDTHGHALGVDTLPDLVQDRGMELDGLDPGLVGLYCELE